MKYLFILAVLLLALQAAPADDKVELLIPGYVKHNWYSGTSYWT